MGNRFKPLSKEEIISLIAVSRREKAASVWIKDGRLANLYTGELEPVHIAIDGKRIAYVGKKEPKADDHTEIIDAKEYILMPGYIEPHAHPFQFYHPYTLADFALMHGTTTYIADNMTFFNRLDLEQWIELMDDLSQHPVKILWWSRLESQSNQEELLKRYSLANIERLIGHPAVIQGGELSNWMNLLNGDDDLAGKMAAVKQAGKRIEGHAPGASEETLNALVAAGVTSDHEAISGEEVLRRLRLGLYAPLRHSSIRPDLPLLLEEIKELKYGWERLMFTTDGSTPPFLEKGFTDALIAIALEHGIDPILAYRMATLNVAVYYRLDEHIGSIAPGRFADILFLASLNHPTPSQVMIEGEMIFSASAEQENYQSPVTIDWNKYDQMYKPVLPEMPVTAEDFRIPWEDGKPLPVLHLINDVITVQTDRMLPVKEGYLDVDQEGLLHIALIDRHGRWISRGLLSGFADQLSALAATYTVSMDYLIIGRNYADMMEAFAYVHQRGGIAIVEEGKVAAHLDLPIGGGLSPLPMRELISECASFQEVLKKKGYPFDDPFYCLLFLTSTHLPKLRITEKGIISIKEQKIILPSEPLQK